MCVLWYMVSFSATIWENLTCINISNSIIPTSKNFPWKSTLVTFLWKFALLRVLCHFFQYGCKAKDINGHASTEICQWNAISSTGLGTAYFNYVTLSFYTALAPAQPLGSLLIFHFNFLTPLKILEILKRNCVLSLEKSCIIIGLHLEG